MTPLSFKRTAHAPHLTGHALSCRTPTIPASRYSLATYVGLSPFFHFHEKGPEGPGQRVTILPTPRHEREQFDTSCHHISPTTAPFPLKAPVEPRLRYAHEDCANPPVSVEKTSAKACVLVKPPSLAKATRTPHPARPPGGPTSPSKRSSRVTLGPQSDGNSRARDSRSLQNGEALLAHTFHYWNISRLEQPASNMVAVLILADNAVLWLEGRASSLVTASIVGNFLLFLGQQGDSTA